MPGSSIPRELSIEHVRSGVGYRFGLIEVVFVGSSLSDQWKLDSAVKVAYWDATASLWMDRCLVNLGTFGICNGNEDCFPYGGIRIISS